MRFAVVNQDSAVIVIFRRVGVSRTRVATDSMATTIVTPA
jgi:hypothetical protein